MLGPFATASRRYIAIHIASRYCRTPAIAIALRRAMSTTTTTTTTTTRDRGDRYGPMEWTQISMHIYGFILQRIAYRRI